MAQVKTEKEMFPLVKGWLESGLTQRQFCTTHQLPVHILAYWVGRYRKAQLEDTTPTTKAGAEKVVAKTSKAAKKIMVPDNTHGFIRLTPPPPSPSPIATGSMEVVLPTGTVIRFSTTVPVDYLTELLSACSH